MTEFFCKSCMKPKPVTEKKIINRYRWACKECYEKAKATTKKNKAKFAKMLREIA